MGQWRSYHVLQKDFQPGTLNLASLKLSLKGKEEHWCFRCKKFGHTKGTWFKLHGKEKVLNRLAKVKGTPSRKAYQASSNSKHLGKTPPSSPKERMLALCAEIEHLYNEHIQENPYNENS